MLTHNPNPFQHGYAKPQQIEWRSSHLHDLGNGNFLDSMPSPPTPKLSTYQEYHGALEKPAKSARTRRSTVSISPCSQNGPFSWPEVQIQTDTQSDSDDVSLNSSSDDVTSQTGVEPIVSPTVPSLQNLDIGRSPGSIPPRFFDKNRTSADNSPTKYIPQISTKFTMNLKLHPYLSLPPFRHSFRDHPDKIHKLGFVGLYDHATTPPTSEMNIICPFLPWPIDLHQSDYLTVYDVLHAIYGLLHESASQAEINILHSGKGTNKKYRKVVTTYRKRLTEENIYQQPDEYIRKIDWLGGKHIFHCLDGRVDERGPFWRLCFHT